MDNLEPGLCPRCHNQTKPLFTSHYCDCDEVTEKIKKNDVKDDEDYSPNPYVLPSPYSANLSIGQSTPMRTAVVINGVQMTHWLECEMCSHPALYMDHDPTLYPGEVISKANGYYQNNYSLTNGSRVYCDFCNRPLHSRNFRLSLLHKY